MEKINLIGQTFDEVKEICIKLGEPEFRAKQIWLGIYVEAFKNFDQFTTLSKELRNKLDEKYTLERPIISKDELSKDGTRKLLLKFKDNNEIETVYIPRVDTGTICISTQIGCNMGCTFCNTGTQKLVRNLTSSEIVAQVLILKDLYNDYKLKSLEKRNINNIVYMGMGEPLQNYKEVKKSIAVFHHKDGLAFSRKKITLSTCGILPIVEKLSEDIPVNLALSLHASNNELRTSLMPINKVYPIEKLIEAAKKYYEKTNTKKISLVYVMIKGVNDTKQHAKELAKIASNLTCKFNLIPFHPWEGCSYESTSEKDIKKFVTYLNGYGYTAPIRKTRGKDISAACGQLKSESKKEIKHNNLV